MITEPGRRSQPLKFARLDTVRFHGLSSVGRQTSADRRGLRRLVALLRFERVCNSTVCAMSQFMISQCRERKWICYQIRSRVFVVGVGGKPRERRQSGQLLVLFYFRGQRVRCQAVDSPPKA